MEVRYGWVCPKCGKALSPDTKACNCYKEEVLIKPLGPMEVEDPFKVYKWVRETPYEDIPIFKFFSTSSDEFDPCKNCPNNGDLFCNCILAGSKVKY